MPRPNTGPRLYFNKDRSRYYIIWYESGKRFKKSTGFPDIARAERYFIDFLQSFHDIPSRCQPSELLISDALKFYAETRAPNCMDPDRIKYAVAALSDFWARKSVEEISQTSCNAYAIHRKASRPSGISDSTIRRELSTLRSALGFCVRERKLTHTVHVPLPAEPEPKDRWLSISEAARLLWEARRGGANSRSYLPLFILIALYTGARSEAILSLTWDRVDLDRRRISFQIPGRPRTKKRRPTIPISTKLLPFLRYARRNLHSEFGTVIHNSGEPIIRIRKSFKAAATRANLRGVTPHTLRHTCATWMAQSGASMFQIAGFLGQDVDTTINRYAHHSPDHMHDAVSSTERRKRRDSGSNII